MRLGRPSKLTPELQARIVAGIRLGAFPSVAARAAGIGASTFYRWMQAGERGAKRFREFREDVEQAGAEARQAAEWEVRKTNPLAWLRSGPGRTRPGEPGWTENAEPGWSGPEGEGTIIVTDPDELAYIEKLRAVRGGKTSGLVEHVVRVVRE